MPTQLKELQVTEGQEEDTVKDVLTSSLLPPEVYESFLEIVSTLDELVSANEETVRMIIDEMAKANPSVKPMQSPLRRRLMVTNLMNLIEFKCTGGSLKQNPTPIEMQAFVSLARETPLSQRLFSPSPTPDQFAAVAPRSINGSKLSEALPTWNGDMLSWFEWKDKVKTKLGQFMDFEKVFESETEAKKDPERSRVLYNIFKEKTLGGSAHTLVDSLGKDKKLGFHAFQALVDAMEGMETCERLKKHASTLKEGAKKDSTTSFLEFQGNIQQYLTVLDKIEALEGRGPLSEEKCIRIILNGVTDKDFKSVVLQLQRELKAGRLTTSDKALSELRTVDTHLDVADEEDRKPPASILQRSKEQKDPGSTKSHAEQKGGPGTVKILDISLPNGLFASMTDEQQCGYQKWHRKLKEMGDPNALRQLEKPTAAEMENIKKWKETTVWFESNENKKRKKYKQRKTKTSKENITRYLEVPCPGLLSISERSEGNTKIDQVDRSLPKLRIVMFKEPKGIEVPIHSSSETRGTSGMLSVNSHRTRNPKEESIDPTRRDYSFVPSPTTILSDVSSRQVKLSRLVRLRKIKVTSEMSPTDWAIPNVYDIHQMARDNASKLPNLRLSKPSQPDFSLKIRRNKPVVSGRPKQTILDTGCDWSVVAIGWRVLHEHEEFFQCQGAFFAGEEISCRLVDAATVFMFPNNPRELILVCANRVLFLDDPDQVESLLDPIQLQAAGVIVNLVAKIFQSRSGEFGSQEMVVDGRSLPFEIDGQQLYFTHRLPTNLELDTMSFVNITSTDPNVYPLPETRKKNAFRRMVQIIRRHTFSKEALGKWKAQLCYVLDAVVIKTLAATSQLIESVEVENRLVPRKHLVGRLTILTSPAIAGDIRHRLVPCFSPIGTAVPLIPTIRGKDVKDPVPILFEAEIAYGGFFT